MKKLFLIATLVSLNCFAYLNDSDEMYKIGEGSSVIFHRDIVFTNNAYDVYIQDGQIINNQLDLDKEKLFCVINVTKQRSRTRKIEAGRIMGIWRTSRMGGGHLHSANFLLDDKKIDALSCNRWFNFFWPTIGDLKETLGDIVTIELAQPDVIYDPMELEDIIQP